MLKVKEEEDEIGVVPASTWLARSLASSSVPSLPLPPLFSLSLYLSYSLPSQITTLYKFAVRR